MRSAGAEEHHYDLTNDDKLFAEFLKAQKSMGSPNTAAQGTLILLSKVHFSSVCALICNQKWTHLLSALNLSSSGVVPIVCYRDSKCRSPVHHNVWYSRQVLWMMTTLTRVWYNDIFLVNRSHWNIHVTKTSSAI